MEALVKRLCLTVFALLSLTLGATSSDSITPFKWQGDYLKFSPLRNYGSSVQSQKNERRNTVQEQFSSTTWGARSTAPPGYYRTNSMTAETSGQLWAQTTQKPWAITKQGSSLRKFNHQHALYKSTQNPRTRSSGNAWIRTTYKPWTRTTQKPWFTTTRKPWTRITETTWTRTTQNPWTRTTQSSWTTKNTWSKITQNPWTSNEYNRQTRIHPSLWTETTQDSGPETRKETQTQSAIRDGLIKATKARITPFPRQADDERTPVITTSQASTALKSSNQVTGPPNISSKGNSLHGIETIHTINIVSNGVIPDRISEDANYAHVLDGTVKRKKDELVVNVGEREVAGKAECEEARRRCYADSGKDGVSLDRLFDDVWTTLVRDHQLLQQAYIEWARIVFINLLNQAVTNPEA